jgi:SulP family sulfate permease
VAAGVMVAILSLMFSLSFSTVVFSGELERFRDAGIVMAMTGSVVYAFASAFLGTVPGTWWGNQAPQVVLVSIGAAAIAAVLSDAQPATVFATIAVFIAGSTFLSGLVLYVIGRARVARQAKFIPYPVIGGFLASTGFFLVVRAADLVVGFAGPMAGLIQPSALWRWTPYVAAGLGLMLLARRLGNGAALLIGLAIYAVGFTAYLGLNDIGLDAAREAGWIIGGDAPIQSGLVPVFTELGVASFGAILDQGWTIGAIVFLTVLGLVMNISALEVQMGRSFDLDRDMAAAGAANMVAATGCGFVGFHSLSMYQLSRSVAQAPVPAIAITAGLLIIGAMLGGMQALEFLPKGLFALVLAYLGVELLWRWLVVAWREMPRGDYAIVVAILATAIAFDFVVAILLGTIAASILFTLAYSRIDVVRSRVSGRLRLSPTERSDRDIATIVEQGDRTLVFELQGYLFFGTANGLFDRVAAEITAEGAGVQDLLVDFRRVEGMDVSAAFVLSRLADMALQNGVRVAFTGVSRGLRDKLGSASGVAGLTFPATLADALQRIEDEVLAQSGGSPDEDSPPSDFGLLLREALARDLPLVEAQRELDAGDVLYAQGDPGDALAYLARGRLSAWVTLPDGGEARVASFLPGAVVGEIAFCAGRHRTASVIADEPCTIMSVTRESLAAAAAADPEITARFHGLLSRLLAERLGRTTALFFALDG